MCLSACVCRLFVYLLECVSMSQSACKSAVCVRVNQCACVPVGEWDWERVNKTPKILRSGVGSDEGAEESGERNISHHF